MAGWFFLRENPSINGWFGGTPILGNLHMVKVYWSWAFPKFFQDGGEPWAACFHDENLQFHEQFPSNFTLAGASDRTIATGDQKALPSCGLANRMAFENHRIELRFGTCPEIYTITTIHHHHLFHHHYHQLLLLLFLIMIIVAYDPHTLGALWIQRKVCFTVKTISHPSEEFWCDQMLPHKS